MIGTLVIALALTGASAHAETPRAVELHSHLFMKEGMGWMATGDFQSPLRAKDWRSRFGSQANAETLQKSGIRVIVASLYAHPVLVWDLRESIRRQVAQAREFVAAHPEWVLATDATQALEAWAAGKRVMILGLEGASGIIDNDADLEEFVDRLGIRVVTLLHLTDDELGGVAFLRGFRAMASPWAFLSQLLSPERDDAGVRINRVGLSALGRTMTEKLVARKVWIDLAHASDHSYAPLRDLFVASGIPLLHTHTSLRKYLGAERGISEAQLRDVARSGGVVGLMASEEMLARTPADCDGTMARLRAQVAEMRAILPDDGLVLGSDTNGGIPHLSPGCGLGPEGFWNIGQTSEVWAQLKPDAQSDHAALRFLCAWARAQRLTPAAVFSCPKV